MSLCVPIRKGVAAFGGGALLAASLVPVAQADPPGGYLVAEANPVEVAQVGTIGGGGLQAPPVATGREDVFVKPGRAEEALALGDWLLYPTAFGGFIYDTNVSQSPSPRGSPGIRLSPAILAENSNDLFKTVLYGNADGRFYFDNIPNEGTSISARAGGKETYTPLPDLIINGQADFTRQKDLFSTLGTDQSVTILNPTGVGLAPTANPQSYNQFTGAASVQKNFSQAFATVSASVVDIMYDQNSGGTAPSPNGVTYTGSLRGGYWIVPVLYGYAEGTLDSRDYATSTLDSSGYRAVVGVGTDQIGLLRGEIFGGYQDERYSTSGLGSTGGPVYGVAGHYYPLPELTVNFSVDEAIGVSLLAATPTSPTGTSTKVDTYLVNANYALAKDWSANARAGYIATDYIGADRNDQAWTIGTTGTYNFFRNVGLTLDYQHVKLSSNAPLAGFTRDVVTVGATWRY